MVGAFGCKIVFEGSLLPYCKLKNKILGAEVFLLSLAGFINVSFPECA